ncbi:hypothetical protein LARV_02660 [Longilinea arvoryzae]|uniref:Uncharacterized protein n=1 Tax=Longilinea arvoryzae TaxID=360412 RepID=A0A0S7BLR1_9CHLR|nr:hypothetical protein [Longilinea arvoryzae]GAP14881.1 hypothetical protein LARV_02660 [Longilinea arvoryzae]
MPTDALPTAAIWDGYAVAGIVFVVILVMAWFVWKAFREYRVWQTAENQAQRKWQDEQFVLRQTENEKQRAWNEQMEHRRSQEASTRDEQMRKFMAAQQEKQIQADQETSRVLNSLVSRIDGLTAVMAAQSKALSDHDAKVEQRFAAATTPKRRGSG